MEAQLPQVGHHPSRRRHHQHQPELRHYRQGGRRSLHYHEEDEAIVVLEGTLEVRLGDQVHRVGADHTLLVPPGAPHGFTSVGSVPARVLGFFPSADPFERTTFLEGQPPEAHRT